MKTQLAAAEPTTEAGADIIETTDQVLDRLLQAAEDRGRIQQQRLEETRKLRLAEEKRLEAEQERARIFSEVLSQLKDLVDCTLSTFETAQASHEHLHHRMDIIVAFIQLAIPILVNTTSQEEVQRLTRLLEQLGSRPGADVVVGGSHLKAGRDVQAGDIEGGSGGR